MTPATLTHRPRQFFFMRMRNSHRIVPTSTQSPRDSPGPVELLPPIHPIKQWRPQAVRGCSIVSQSRTIACPWYLDTNSSPPTCQMAFGCVSQFGSIPVKPEDLDDTRNWISGWSMLWKSYIDGNGGTLAFNSVGVRYLKVAELARK